MLSSSSFYSGGNLKHPDSEIFEKHVENSNQTCGRSQSCGSSQPAAAAKPAAKAKHPTYAARRQKKHTLSN
ncbi:BnaC06g10760D [Brassica napus]|uniref:BnaC06g10760D protein n=1 Tax=Brassica napus TaxID=3708 RepID=A0A078GI45_BRANA|nr:BnaC06g10760D [Brassica napus]